MDFGVRDLAFNESVIDKLWRHSVQEFEAWEVLWEDPVFKRQDAQEEIRDDGSLRKTNARLLMIGRTHSGRLLTIVLELPDADGISEVVTGFNSKGNELGWYRQRGGV